MGRRRRAVLVVVGLLAVPTVVLGVAADQTRMAPTPEALENRCVQVGYAVYESSERPSAFAADQTRYANLTPAQQTLLDRAVANEGDPVPLRTGTERAAVDGLGGTGAVLVDGTVYRDGGDLRCQRIAGVPVAPDPYVGPFISLYRLFAGPLLPLVVLGGAAGVAYAVGEWARY